MERLERIVGNVCNDHPRPLLSRVPHPRHRRHPTCHVAMRPPAPSSSLAACASLAVRSWSVFGVAAHYPCAARTLPALHAPYYNCRRSLIWQVVKPIADIALEISKLSEITGRTEPSVIT